MNRILAMEYIVALSISSYAAIKDKQLPWPPTVVRTSIAFGILGVIAMMNERFAYVLAGAFLLAQLLSIYEKGEAFTGGAPKNLGDGDGAMPNALGSGKDGHPGILSFGDNA